MKRTKTHLFFYGGFLSNWATCKFTDPNGVKIFSNTEQAFMYYKAVVFGDLNTAAEILNTPEPDAAKALGRKISGYNDKMWECLRYGYMVYVNYLKFSQNANLREHLRATEDLILVEASPTDRIWGIGLSVHDAENEDESKWNGTNLLGKALMEVRQKL